MAQQYRSKRVGQPLCVATPAMLQQLWLWYMHFDMECKTTIDTSVGYIARQRCGHSHVWRDVNNAAVMLSLRPLTCIGLYFGMKCRIEINNAILWKAGVIGRKNVDVSVVSYMLSQQCLVSPHWPSSVFRKP